MTIATAVHDSSPSFIIHAAKKLRKSALSKSRWLFRNTYQSDVIETLKAEGTDLPKKPLHLAEYIAASSVLHCSDGWKFYSLSMDNLLHGDLPNAVFMAYYAQLRALMSFFATEGIGVFRSKHYYFDVNGNCNTFNSPTHVAVKELINAWALDIGKSPRFLELLKFEDKPFIDWISSADITLGSPVIPELAKDWLFAWSIDLNILGNDHIIRNEVSYRPQGIENHAISSDFRKVLFFCLETWRAIEPFASNRFSILDKHLLRETLLALYRHRNSQLITYKQFVSSSMVDLGITSNSFLFRFLASTNLRNSHNILRKARKPALNGKNEIDALSVICRSLILLRIASAAVENFLEKSSITSQDIEFWWSDYGENNCLWLPGNEPSQMSDLWADIDDVIANLDFFLDQNKNQISRIKAQPYIPNELWQIKYFTKAGLWAIGL